MMTLTNINKDYGNDKVIRNLNLEFPRTGIVTIYGASGCGKTTLLNILALLLPFQGRISINGKDISNYSEYQKDKFRNQKVGFIFQDYKLFENETVFSNLKLAIDIKCVNNKTTKEKRIFDLLRLVGLTDKVEEKVFNLSGGEKQRLAIARSLSNSPSIILADEPTGNLDETNSKEIMKIIQKISKSSLVVLVSHDEDLTRQYSDIVFTMKDGQIINKEYTNHNIIDEPINLIKVDSKEKEPKLPFSFCFLHTFHKFKERKWRTTFSFLTTSLSLIGVGLGTVLSKIVSTNLTNSYSSIIDQNQVIIQPKSIHQEKNIIKSAPFIEIDEIRNSLNPIPDYGVYYWNNFESMFPNYSFNLVTNEKVKLLPDFTVRHFNDFKNIHEHENIMYPNQLIEIANDSVVLGLTYGTLNEICYQFQIPKTITALSQFIDSNNVTLSLDLANGSWEYHKEIFLKICGVTISQTNLFIHSNRLWNEYIYEKMFGLSTTDVINENTGHPWDLIKSYFLEIKEGRDDYLTKNKFSQNYRYYQTEILSSNYYPFLLRNKDHFECNRVAILTSKIKDELPGYYYKYIDEKINDVNGVIYGSQLGYTVYPDNLMIGFGRQIFVSKDSNYIQYVIDITSYIKESESHNINIPSKVMDGHFTKSGSSGVTFNSHFKLSKGKKPETYSEIVISSALANKLGISLSSFSNLYFAYPTKEELLPNGYISRDYKIIDLQVVGISESNKYELNHISEWSIMFFQCMVGLSCFNLPITAFALDVNEGKENYVINQINKAFPSLKSSCPINSVRDSINEICSYIEKILLVISVISTIICILLLIMCNSLYFKEIKKDIGLIRCLGINKKESKKMVYSHAIFTIIISFLISLIELFVICFVLSKVMASTLEIDATFVFNPMAIIYMLTISVIITLLSTISTSLKMNHYSPLECLY